MGCTGENGLKELGALNSNTMFPDNTQCREYVRRTVTEVIQRYAVNEYPQYETSEGLADIALTVLEYYAGIAVGDILQSSDNYLIGYCMTCEELSAKWDSFIRKKADELNKRERNSVETTERILYDAGLIHRFYGAHGAKAVFSQSDIQLSFCCKVIRDPAFGECLEYCTERSIRNLQSALCDMVCDRLNGILKSQNRKYMYHSVIAVKEDLSEDKLVELKHTAERAFANRAGLIKNSSTDPYTFVFSGDDEERGCLDLGIIELEKNDTFLSCIGSWRWIDTEEPSENTDLLELAGENSRKRQKQEEQ